MIRYINETFVREKEKSMNDKTYKPKRNEKEAILTVKTN